MNNRKTLLVDIILKDKTVLSNCAIYPEDVKSGQEGFTTVGEINDAFRKVPWGRRYIAFQNEMINGHTHVNNVEYYVIK